MVERKSDGDRVLLITRVLDAPRTSVFEAWTSQERLHAWWGPIGFTTTTREFNFSVGGVWRFVMHGPDGRDYQNRIVFDEIEPPARIAYHHPGGPDAEPVSFSTLVTFAEIGRKTRVELRMAFATAEDCARVEREYGALEGGRQTLARLASTVEPFDPGAEIKHETLVMERTLAASPARVFAAWVDLEARICWSAPSPATRVVYDQAQFHEGGLDISRCGEDDDLKYCAEVRYLEIAPDRRLVFAETVSADGDRLSMALVTIELWPDSAGARMKFTAQIAALPGSDMAAGYRQGWGAAFDNLAKECAR